MHMEEETQVCIAFNTIFVHPSSKNPFLQKATEKCNSSLREEVPHRKELFFTHSIGRCMKK